MTAIHTANNFAGLMHKAAHGSETLAGVRACENSAAGAEWVAAYLSGRNRFGAPVTLEDAQKGARRAWGDDIPADVRAALEMTE